MRNPFSWYKHKCECAIPHPTARKAFHGAHSMTHLVYFGAVAAEGHGVYAMAGGGLLIFGIVAVFLHMAGDD